MTEAKLTRTFLARWRERYPHAVVFKINDRTTSGIPDAAITMGGRTAWIEFKRDAHTLTALQRTTLLKLDQASEGRAFLVVFDTRRKQITVYDLAATSAAATYRTFPNRDEAISYLVAQVEFGR